MRIVNLRIKLSIIEKKIDKFIILSKYTGKYNKQLMKLYNIKTNIEKKILDCRNERIQNILGKNK